ncbi:hypothetical protein [Lentilactobacillus hilgardii]|uniref:hypothetical protein n=1 Tax=Lentilactobacillus hilgardii TaxID=1588 RepID=UPI0021A69804|nr:hypothetical protein [Lentilactobacillus hilgardii]
MVAYSPKKTLLNWCIRWHTSVIIFLDTSIERNIYFGMKCIPFCQKGKTAFSIIEMLDALIDTYENCKDENQAKIAYRRYLLIVKCLATASKFEVRDFEAIMQGKRRSLKSGHLLFYDDVSQKDVEINSFELVKNIEGWGNKDSLELYHFISQSPIFELRINACEFGFRSILFLSSKEFGDHFDQFQCYCDSFRKEKYNTRRARRIGNKKTNEAVLSTAKIYQSFRKDENSFSTFFDDARIIVGEGGSYFDTY